jgi:hypothetical protein
LHFNQGNRPWGLSVLDGRAHDGAFDGVNNRCARAGLMFAVNYDATTMNLEVAEQPVANGDLDFNDRIDLRNVAHLRRCFVGAAGSLAPC